MTLVPCFTQSLKPLFGRVPSHLQAWVEIVLDFELLTLVSSPISCICPSARPSCSLPRILSTFIVLYCQSFFLSHWREKVTIKSLLRLKHLFLVLSLSAFVCPCPCERVFGCAHGHPHTLGGQTRCCLFYLSLFNGPETGALIQQGACGFG